MGKIRLNKDGLKGLFVNHVEKMVLVVVLLVFGVFVYASLGLEGLPATQTPDKLIETAKSAREKINSPDNAKEVLASVTISTGYINRVDEQLKATKADFYTITKPPSPYYGQEGQKRIDPNLLPPEKVEVAVMTGGLAYIKTPEEEDELAKEPNSTNVPKVDPKKAAKKKKEQEGMMGMGMSSAGMDPTGGMPSTSSGVPNSSSMMGMGMPGMGMPGMEGATGLQGGVLANVADRSGFIAGQGSIAKSRTFVAVKFVVPWKKQWEEYQDKFKPALGYNPTRDTPTYISFRAERLEVTGDPQEELDWSKATVMSTPKLLENFTTAGFYGIAPEIADPRYLYYGVLTFPLPPVINRDLEPVALHSDVPKVTTVAVNSFQADSKKKDVKKKTTDDSDVPTDLPAATSPDGTGIPGSGMPGSGMPGSGMPGMGMPGMGMPGMGMPGMGMPGMGSENGTMNSSSMGMGMPGMGMPGMGMPGMGMPGAESGNEYSSMGMMGADGSMATPGPSVPHLLGRFFDFTVEPGKKYRYRVQIIMEDPNRPRFAQLDPSDRYLDDEVKKRLNQVALDEKATKTQARIYYRRTEFSEPSEPIAVAIKPIALAGQVSPAKLTNAPEKTQDKILAEEPEAKVMSVVWDEVKATDVVGISDVFRGTYLNFQANADAIHPVILVFKSLPKYDFQTNHLVADIRGGEEFPVAPGAKDPALLAPGQYALIDDSGQIVIRTEFDDWDAFRKLALPELPEPAGGAGAMMGAGDEGDIGAGPPGMGMPGMGGKKGKGSRPPRGSANPGS